METKLCIGGKFVLGAGESEEILNPATGELIARIPSASPEQVDQAVTAATRAFLTWSATTPGQPSGMLLKLADKIEAEAEDSARLESQNCGKPYTRVLADEIPAIVDCFRFFAGAARCMSGSAHQGLRLLSARCRARAPRVPRPEAARRPQAAKV
jgi:aminobutyraldehyde dehydrogenase